jgi:hypothetical protein
MKIILAVPLLWLAAVAYAGTAEEEVQEAIAKSEKDAMDKHVNTWSESLGDTAQRIKIELKKVAGVSLDEQITKALREFDPKSLEQQAKVIDLFLLRCVELRKALEDFKTSDMGATREKITRALSLLTEKCAENAKMFSKKVEIATAQNKPAKAKRYQEMAEGIRQLADAYDQWNSGFKNIPIKEWQDETQDSLEYLIDLQGFLLELRTAIKNGAGIQKRLEELKKSLAGLSSLHKDVLTFSDLIWRTVNEVTSKGSPKKNEKEEKKENKKE